MWLYLIYRHSSIGNNSRMTSGIVVVLPVVYQWKIAIKFGGFTTGKTMDSSCNTIDFFFIQLNSVIIP